MVCSRQLHILRELHVELECYSFQSFLSLSHTHTHTHTHCIQGHLKKRKLESGKAQPASKAKEGQAAKGGKGGKKTRKSVEDEVEEESKLFCSLQSPCSCIGRMLAEIRTCFSHRVLQW